MRFATSLCLLTISSAALAGPALDEDASKPAPSPAATTAEPAPPPAPDGYDANQVEHGVDLRLREVFLPSAIMGLFVDRAAGGATNTGIGVDLVRRRGNLELQLGFEYEHINLKEGVYINKGDNVANGDTVDYILGPNDSQHWGGTSPQNFGWFTLEFTFMNHTPINKYVSLRYGLGAGIGILTGGVYRWDTACVAGSSNANVTGCVPSQAGGPGTTEMDKTGAPEPKPVAYDLPPVFPVVNLIGGVQIKPTPKAVVNIEFGIRTLPFIGMSAGYFFD
ncbi:MAG TPA: hypothetical protein VLX92_17540 [Kofleriaceae bacterium]|nr:hypothetical protein [Kofleriaceae bacterium]